MGDAFAAPWSRLLKSISVLGTILLAGIPLLILRVAPPLPGGLTMAVAGLPLAILAACLIYTVRGYELAGGELLIHRLLWPTRVSLDGLRSVELDPEALQGSLRLFGNGGLFSFSGWFRNKSLGVYRAYVTDHRRAVILTWDERRIVVSPEPPERFVEALRRRRGLGG